MNFTSARTRRRRWIARLEITSMVDVIFLLLIYFLLSTTYDPPESQLDQALQAQQVAGGRAADLQPQVVEVGLFDGVPGFLLGSTIYRDREGLRAALEQLPKEAGVFVRGAPQVTTVWAVDAMQACHDAGFILITYVPGREDG